MADRVLPASGSPGGNGSAAAGKGPLPLIGAIDGAAQAAGTVPYANADSSPDVSPENERHEHNSNSLAGDVARGGLFGEQERAALSPSSPRCLCAAAGLGSDGVSVSSDGTSAGSAERGLETTGTAGAETPTASADGRGNATEEEEEEEEVEDEDTEEDEVQVIEIKKEKGEGSLLQQPDSGREAATLASPGCNSPLEKPGEQPGPGKKNDISRHSYSRYNTISYRRIRKGNTKQRIDEFESMMHL
ncbi:ERMIN protein, partial [Upupa epops]|nr:ERMIN protein [Upupa epops]